MGYAIDRPQQNPSRPKCRYSNKLRQTWNCSDDLADRILARFLACKSEDVPGDALHLTHDEPRRHHLHAGAHHAAHAAAARALGLLDQRIGAGELGQERLYFVGWPFLDQEGENYPDSFLRRRSVYPDIGNEPSDQFVHCPLASPTL